MGVIQMQHAPNVPQRQAAARTFGRQLARQGGGGGPLCGACPDGAPRSPPNPPGVTVLATGGTIAGAQTPHSKGGYRSGFFSIESLILAAPGVESLARLEAVHVASIGSQDMSESVWRALALGSRPPSSGRRRPESW